MSVRVMAAAWELDIPSTEKLVLLALADWSNDDGVCWPPMTKLSAKCGLTDRAVRNCIGRLVDGGHLTRNEKPGKGVTYTVHPGTKSPPEPNSPRNEKAETPERRSSNTPVTIKPQKAKPSSVARETKPLGFHRMPDGWIPTKPFPMALQAKLDDWPPGKLDDELDALRGWAANAKNEQGKGRKLDWDQAAHNWLRKADDDWRSRNGSRNGSRAIGTAGNRGASALDAAELAMQDFGYHRH